MIFFLLYCPIGRDEKPLCRRIALRLLLDESIKMSISYHYNLSPLIWSIQQCCCNQPKMTYLGTWKTVLILSHGLDTSRKLLLVLTDVSLLRRELSSSADSFEKVWFHLRSLSSACVKDTDWSSSSSDLYESSTAYNSRVIMPGIRAIFHVTIWLRNKKVWVMRDWYYGSSNIGVLDMVLLLAIYSF